MPFGDFINEVPPALFLLVHLTGFAVGAYLAWRLAATDRGISTGFALYAAAELCYMTYHLDWTTFLFAHTISEVLDLAAFVLIFAGLAKRLLATRQVAR